MRKVLVLMVLVCPSNVATAIADPASVTVIHAPKADLHLEVARTLAQRQRGLMARTTIPRHTGMIFVFDTDGPVEFWMKDTPVSLDMVFVGSDGVVRRIYANVPTVAASLPDAEIPRESATARYVIELAAGETAKDGIALGTKLDLRKL